MQVARINCDSYFKHSRRNQLLFTLPSILPCMSCLTWILLCKPSDHHIVHEVCKFLSRLNIFFWFLQPRYFHSFCLRKSKIDCGGVCLLHWFQKSISLWSGYFYHRSHKVGRQFWVCCHFDCLRCDSCYVWRLCC